MKALSYKRKIKIYSEAFTIVELLVVIAVIAVLAAITVVSYTGVTKQAHISSVKSVLEQAVKSLETYKISTSTDESYPTADASNNPPSNISFGSFTNAKYYTSSNSKSYCLQGITDGNTYSVSSTNQSIVNKPCTENSLVGWWKLNGNVLDSSGNGNDGAIGSSPSIVAGSTVNVVSPLSQGAYLFDGVDDYVSAPTNGGNFGANQDFSVSFWIKTTQVPANYLRIIGRYGYSDNHWRGWSFMFDPNSGGRVYFELVSEGIQSDAWSVSVNNGAWHHLVGIRSGSKIYLYIDGNLGPTSDTTIGSLIGDASASFRLGDVSFCGSIDDMRAYNRALSANEVQQLYSAGAQ